MIFINVQTYLSIKNYFILSKSFSGINFRRISKENMFQGDLYSIPFLAVKLLLTFLF